MSPPRTQKKPPAGRRGRKSRRIQVRYLESYGFQLEREMRIRFAFGIQDGFLDENQDDSELVENRLDSPFERGHF